MTRPQRAPYAFPPSYDNDTKVWVQLERDSLPFILGATLGLLKRGAWGSEADWRSGSQMALRTQESLMSVSRAHATHVLLDEQSTPPTAPAAGQLVIYAENGSILRTLRPGGSQGQIAELDRAQTWSAAQVISDPATMGPMLHITQDASVPPATFQATAQLEISQNRQAGVLLDTVSETPSVASMMYLRRHRGSLAEKTSVVNGDRLGEIQWIGRVGTSPRAAVRMIAVVPAEPQNGRVPGELRIFTEDVDHDARLMLRLRSTGAVWVGSYTPSALDSDGDVHAAGRVRGTAIHVGSNQVVGTRGAAVPDASGGTVVDVEARAALNALLSRLRAHGLIAS